MRSDISVGANFPDYQLEDQSGVPRRLSELQGGNPMVLHLSRGSYDPKEHRFLRNLVDSYPEFRVAYTRLVVVSTDNPLNLNEFRDSLGALWPFLGDPERTVQRDLDIEEFTDPHNPMIPHTFVLAVDSADQQERIAVGLEARNALLHRREHSEWIAVVGRDPDGVAVTVTWHPGGTATVEEGWKTLDDFLYGIGE